MLFRSMFEVSDGVARPSEVVHWLGINGFRTLNVAGDPESTYPGIGERTERFLIAVFRKLAEG